MKPRHRVGGYREFAPTADAAFFCEAFWSHQTPPGPCAPGAGHRVLPDAAVSVAFQVFRDLEGRPIQGSALVIGPKFRPQIFPLLAGRELTAIRLKPEWVAPMLGVDPMDLENQIAELSAIRPDFAEQLHDRLWSTRSAAAVMPILATAVAGSRVSRAAPPPAAAAALEIVRRSAGRLRCKQVAETIGVSMRHLRRQVHDSAGMSPKLYARVLRLVLSMQIADAAASPAWADVALRSGYCDQSHLIRECLALTATSPADLHAERARQVVDMAEMSNPA